MSELVLAHFRNYERLGLEPRPGVAVFCGQNAQGKTNLLEAVYVLATSRSPRASTDRELLSWTRPSDEVLTPPFARVEGRVRHAGGETHLEVLFRGETPEADGEAAPVWGSAGEVTGPLARSIKVNGLPSRAAGLIGNLTVVYFSPDDVALASGPPAGRRRYLDIANSLVAPLYLRGLQQFNRVLLQRNQVLKQLRERRQSRGALEPWTDQMVRHGSLLLRHRLAMLRGVNGRIDQLFHELAGSGQRLQVEYRSTLGALPETDNLGEIAHHYVERQGQLAAREVDQAVSLLGPHRDDFAFMLDGVDLNTYGSRGQQRLAVLALKLSEAEWMREQTGELPVLLLDDVLSELDPQKQRYLLERVGGAAGHDPVAEGRQVWITTTDLEHLPPAFLEASQHFNVDAGRVRVA